MFTFYHREKVLTVNSTNAFSAMEIADKKLVSVCDGYWNRTRSDPREYTWTPIISTRSILIDSI